ncbi:hypothetical protein DAPPUDRAFT_309076 [Daphnia pulex]|uniref:Uncharacterized protein n=1 Tax=Daphnia pulex TaxID=6669 RepID=E9G3I3_DAPPU|nr:hypothetical protein DAPPUDRAFT_309076 [Daphnia pulex]|eukprot:EFX85778.1 hypothetical protein DAPPUDRAFT_309076 [Daphnia pulex]
MSPEMKFGRYKSRCDDQKEDTLIASLSYRHQLVQDQKMLSPTFLVAICFVAFQSSSVGRASLILHGTPLLSPVTEFTFEVATSTLIKGTNCYITSGQVSQCRRKRGMVEQPEIVSDEVLDIQPSEVLKIEASKAPRALNFNSNFNNYQQQQVASSFDDSYTNYVNLFRTLSTTRGRNNNVISVGNCGLTTVNISEFLSCLGMTVQETTTLTATFTEISILSSGYNVMTVLGCTPAGFNYEYCPESALTASAELRKNGNKPQRRRTTVIKRPVANVAGK